MKKYIECFLILSLLFCGSVFSQTDLTGTWQGKLATSPNEKMTIQFILTKQANGSYAALMNSPDTGAIKNVPATGVRFAGGILTIDVASLSGSIQELWEREPSRANGSRKAALFQCP